MSTIHLHLHRQVRDRRRGKDTRALITAVPAGPTGLDYKVIFPDGTTGVYSERMAKLEIASWIRRTGIQAQVEWKPK
jgi:hypothetical protein